MFSRPCSFIGNSCGNPVSLRENATKGIGISSSTTVDEIRSEPTVEEVITIASEKRITPQVAAQLIVAISSFENIVTVAA